MACTNRCGWPGNRWGRGPNWAITGVIRPVTEIARSVVIAVDDLTGARAHQLLVDTAAAGQPARCAIRCGATVVDLAGGKPAIGHGEHTAVASGLIGQLGPDRPHRSVGDGAPVG